MAMDNRGGDGQQMAEATVSGGEKDEVRGSGGRLLRVSAIRTRKAAGSLRAGPDFVGQSVGGARECANG